jgi:hypothetical protein
MVKEKAEMITEIRFAPLALTSTTVRVEWSVVPETEIYARTHFTLDFGDALDPRTMPLKLWWTVAILCIHSHWNLLRPCRVILPVTLDPGEIEFWLRLLDQERLMLEMTRNGTDFNRTVEIACEGPLLADGPLPETGNRYGATYSGGKDSLLQASMLCEFTERPLLVNTCSPMPPMIDHDRPQRDRAINEFKKRRDVEMVVVNTDLRSIWSHYEVPKQLGYGTSMPMITDPFLYAATTFAVAASRGVSSISLACEMENAYVIRYHGRLSSQPGAFANSLLVVSALDRLFSRWGIKYNSLITPFNNFQVMQLIRRRYADLADLQISCFWIENELQRYCSRCHKCFRIAVMMMALGEDPGALGLDLEKMFGDYIYYDPELTIGDGGSTTYAASVIDMTAARKLFPPRGILDMLTLRERRSFRIFTSIIKRLSQHTHPEIVMTHSAYFRFTPPDLRDRLRDLSLEYWPETDPDDRSDEMAQFDSTLNCLVEPLS